ncbi:MAG: DUF1569 domain-containing protein [Bacteroidota bacterium]
MQTDRRGFIKGSIVAAIAAPNLILSGCRKDDLIDRDLQFNSMDQGYDEAVRLSRIELLVTDTAFSLPQTLIHCAQSIEFSMAGFPEPKSALFQKTVGSVAFSVFSWRGRMSHDLSEAIPGAKALNPTVTVEQALQRLRNSIDAFRASESILKPHFAYGTLTKNEYERAHAMHLADHFSAING